MTINSKTNIITGDTALLGLQTTITNSTRRGLAVHPFDVKHRLTFSILSFEFAENNLRRSNSKEKISQVQDARHSIESIWAEYTKTQDLRSLHDSIDALRDSALYRDLKDWAMTPTRE